MIPDADHALDSAIQAVTEAAHLCMEVQQERHPDESLAKTDKSPVTVADFGAQAVISHLLAEAFPEIPLLAEEDAAALREPAQAHLFERVCRHVRNRLPALSESDVLAAIDRGGHAGGATGCHWVLDPIDGTKGFLRRDQYAIALALIDAGEVVAGVLGCPALPIGPDPDGPVGCLFLATRGGGAFMRPLAGGADEPVRVTALTDPARARFCESVEAAHSSHNDASRIAAHLGVTEPPFRIDSQCKYGAVARGDASIYLRLPTRVGYEERVWDHAAGSIVVEEAGGRVTDIDGKPLDYSLGRTLRNNTGIVATNGLLHDNVLAAVQAVLQ